MKYHHSKIYPSLRQHYLDKRTTALTRFFYIVSLSVIFGFFGSHLLGYFLFF